MASPTTQLDLPIEGMTCASCAARVERRLNEVDGVEATVNYATARATVAYDPRQVRPEDLVTTVEETGYHAALPSAHGDHDHGAHDDAALADLRRRLIVSAPLALAVVLVSMVPALQFAGWEWAALALATPVALWGAMPFHRATWLNLRHRAATMDTLITLGTLTAWTWSTVVVLTGADQELYFEVSAVVVVFLLDQHGHMGGAESGLAMRHEHCERVRAHEPDHLRSVIDLIMSRNVHVSDSPWAPHVAPPRRAGCARMGSGGR